MIWKWSDRAPRPNVKVHPLDVHALPKRLRGEEEPPEDRSEMVIVYAFAAVMAWSIAIAIVVFA